MNFLAIIPARYGSTRFPGKPLTDINGRSMILRVCDQALSAGIFTDIVVATDDSRISDHVTAGGFQAIMTSSSHLSGTDRCLEAMEKWQSGQGTTADYVINIQGDEPFIQPEQIRKVHDILSSGDSDIATLASLITHREDIFNPNVVKVVFDKEMFAMYFSRSPVPFLRTVSETQWTRKKAHYRHIGIYGFKAVTLKTVCNLPEGVLEKHESLEQLRWLENGFRIRINITHLESVSIDTPEDLLNITNIA